MKISTQNRKPLFDDKTEVPLIISIADAWQLETALRLAAKHPRLKALPRRFSEMADLLQGAIVTRHPRSKKAFSPGVGHNSFMRMATPAMADTVPLELTITISDAYVVLLAAQLTTRHPEMSADFRRYLTNAGHQFQDTVTSVYPETQGFLERGWNPQYDVES